MTHKIVIVPYNSEWPLLFQQEQKKIEAALADFQPIVEHVGSTSVVGLGAKPIIDIMVGIPDASRLDELRKPMLQAGYCYVSYYEDVLPERRYFVVIQGREGDWYKQREDKFDSVLYPCTHHIHIVPLGSHFWKRHLFFRDYLRTHDEARDAYYALKKELSRRVWTARNDYTAAKSAFIRNIEKLQP